MSHATARSFAFRSPSMTSLLRFVEQEKGITRPSVPGPSWAGSASKGVSPCVCAPMSSRLCAGALAILPLLDSFECDVDRFHAGEVAAVVRVILQRERLIGGLHNFEWRVGCDVEGGECIADIRRHATGIGA